MFGNLLDKVTKGVCDFADDPIGATVNTITQPIKDGVNVIGGFTEGELREAAVIRLGAGMAGSMALGELIEWHDNL